VSLSIPGPAAHVRRGLALALALLVLAGASLGTVQRRADAADGVLTVLLLGADVGLGRAGDPASARADAFQLLFVSPDRQHASFVSIPRDSWVPVAGRGTTRINACLNAGPDACVRTVEALWGIRVDGWVLTSMDGFVGAVNDFGGLVVDVTTPVFDGGMDIPSAGLQPLVGDQAMTWGRDRKNRAGGDFARSRAQAELLAVAHAHLHARGSAGAAADAVGILSRHARTSFGPAQLAAFALDALRLPPGNVRRSGLPARAGWAGPASVVFLEAGADAIVRDAAADGILSNPERIGVGVRGPFAFGAGPLGSTTASVNALGAVPSATISLTTPPQRSEAIRRLQVLLNERQGAGLDADGVYGPSTARAVAELQRVTGRQVTGEVRLRLWEQLFGAA
jgi:LCP family protein required for cell wall assembly